MTAGLAAYADDDPLAAGFENPPVSAKPYTWWHWMNGNITAEGITADLEAMKRVGVGGAEIFNVDCGIPHGPVQFMSPQWQKLFTHAIKEADRLGLKLYVHNCAGWSSSGGPWNTPEHAMQKVVTSEVRMKGPATFSELLPQPETNLGFYRDVAVLAFPCPAGEDQPMKAASPMLTTSFAGADVSKLVDDDSKTFIDLPAPTKAKPQFVQIEFPQSFTAQTVSLDLRSTGVKGEVQVSSDGKTFRRVQSF
ncbi:MAG TPA: glycosyl hydrolase, partial [Candidatus Binatia bacterium]|nr:glycosyl hydrolase [Candidatus Binatia bacterium]